MNRERLNKHIKIDEGLSLSGYIDTTGNFTIGYGHNLERGITQEQADCILKYDIDDVERTLRVTYWWFETLNDARQEAIVNMAFNLGTKGFASFQKMILSIIKHDWEQVEKEALDSLWASQVGSRAKRIAKILKTGVIHNEN